MALETVGMLGLRQTPDYTHVPEKPREEALAVSSAFPFVPPIKSEVVYIAPVSPVHVPHIITVLGVDWPERPPQVAFFLPTWSIVQKLATQSIVEAALSHASQRLDTFPAKGENWYFHGARAISHTTVARAKEVLFSLGREAYSVGKKMEPSAIGPLVTGAIQLEWREDRGNLEVEVGPQGDFSYLLTVQQGPEEEGTAGLDRLQELFRRIL